METTQYKGLTIRIEADTDCTSPLEYDECVFITYRAGARSCYGNTPLDQEAHEDIARQIEAGTLIGLPVYVYQHSGVLIQASEGNPFSCPWDSGQSGYVYVTKKTALDWQGGKVLTAKKRTATLDSLRSVVSEYSKWCNGECYGYIIEDGAGEQLESCWGFIGYEYAEQEAQSAADCCIVQIEKDRKQASAQKARETRERNAWACRGMVTQ